DSLQSAERARERLQPTGDQLAPDAERRAHGNGRQRVVDVIEAGQTQSSSNDTVRGGHAEIAARVTEELDAGRHNIRDWPGEVAGRARVVSEMAEEDHIVAQCRPAAWTQP